MDMNKRPDGVVTVVDGRSHAEELRALTLFLDNIPAPTKRERALSALRLLRSVPSPARLTTVSEEDLAVIEAGKPFWDVSDFWDNPRAFLEQQGAA